MKSRLGLPASGRDGMISVGFVVLPGACHQEVEDGKNPLAVGVHPEEVFTKRRIVLSGPHPLVEQLWRNVNLFPEGIGGTSTQKHPVEQGRLSLGSVEFCDIAGHRDLSRTGPPAEYFSEAPV